MYSRLIYFACSLTTTILCIFLKVPQLITIFKSKSTDGISMQSLVFELWACLTMMSYSYANGYPFTNYSEYPCVVLQDIILLLMILTYKNTLSIKWISGIILICSFHFAIAVKILPMFLSVILLQIGSPIAWYSKGIQTWIIVKNRDAGQVSVLTWTMNSFATGSRLLSLFLTTVWDKLVITSLVISLFLNISVVIAARVYRPKTKNE